MKNAIPNPAKKTNILFKTAFALMLLMGIGCALNGCVSDQKQYQRRADNSATQASAESRPLKRGINLSRWWEAEHDRALDSSDIRRLQALDLDFVRLPLDPQALDLNGDETSTKENLKALRHDLETLFEAGFSVILDLHPKDDFQRRLINLSPDEAQQKLETVWRKLGSVIKGLPPKRLLLEILNEPKFGTSRWWKIQEKLVANLRSMYPDNTLIASTSPDNGWWQLDDLTPYKTPNVIYDFHFYEPMVFTHHQVEWDKDFDPRRAELPVPYPVDSADSAASKTDDPAIRAYLRQNWNHEKVSKLVKKIAAWKNRHKATLACLEFGVYRKHVDEQSRLGWLRDLRKELENNGIPWAMWEYKGPFGLLPIDADHGDAPDSNMINALGLENRDMP